MSDRSLWCGDTYKGLFLLLLWIGAVCNFKRGSWELVGSGTVFAISAPPSLAFPSSGTDVATVDVGLVGTAGVGVEVACDFELGSWE